MRPNRKKILAEIQKYGVNNVAKDYPDIPKSTLYTWWKPRKERIKQKIWETKKAHPQWTNKEIKEKLGVYFSESTISRIIQTAWIKERPSILNKEYLPLLEKYLSLIKKKQFRELLSFQLSRPMKTRSTILSNVKEFNTYLLANKDSFRDKRGLFLQLPKFGHDVELSKRQDKRESVIRYRYKLMKKIDEVCLKNGIDLRSMVWNEERIGEAAFIIYSLKKALRNKKKLEEALTICKKIIDLAKLNTTNRKPALLGMI